MAASELLCDSVPAVNLKQHGGPLFAKFGAKVYILDRRIELAENSLDSPANSVLISAADRHDNTVKCPTGNTSS